MSFLLLRVSLPKQHKRHLPSVVWRELGGATEHCVKKWIYLHTCLSNWLQQPSTEATSVVGCDVDCWLELEGKCFLLHEAYVTVRRGEKTGENQSLWWVLSLVSVELNLNTHTHTHTRCNVEDEGEGYGPLPVAAAPVGLKTRRATCGISACTFIPHIQTIPSQVSTALVITCIAYMHWQT